MLEPPPYNEPFFVAYALLPAFSGYKALTTSLLCRIGSGPGCFLLLILLLSALFITWTLLPAVFCYLDLAACYRAYLLFRRCYGPFYFGLSSSYRPVPLPWPGYRPFPVIGPSHGPFLLHGLCYRQFPVIGLFIHTGENFIYQSSPIRSFAFYIIILCGEENHLSKGSHIEFLGLVT